MIGTVRQSALTWLGMLGGAMTLLSNLQGILDLAKWANWLATIWAEFVEPVVAGVLALIDVRVASDAGMLIAMAVFISATAIGARIENSTRDSRSEHWPVQWGNVFNYRILIAVFLYLLEAALVSIALSFPILLDLLIRFPLSYTLVCTLLYLLAIIVGLKGWPIVNSFIVALCLLAFSNVFSHSIPQISAEPNVSQNVSTAIAAIFAVLCGITVVAVAPPRTFTKRLVFMMVGTGLIVALSELSKLGLQTVPTH